MGGMPKPALERVARTLCRRDGHPENIQFEGKPMWQSYLATAHAVLVAIREPDEQHVAWVKAEGVWNCAEDEIGCIYTALIDQALQEPVG